MLDILKRFDNTTVHDALSPVIFFIARPKIVRGGAVAPVSIRLNTFRIHRHVALKVDYKLWKFTEDTVWWIQNNYISGSHYFVEWKVPKQGYSGFCFSAGLMMNDE